MTERTYHFLHGLGVGMALSAVLALGVTAYEQHYRKPLCSLKAAP